MGTEQNAAPKVSIIVPIYNMERYLGKCLDALTKQTLVDIEIVAVNDGSTDSSLSILCAYAEKDPRIRIIDKPNSGYGASMNRGIDEARGEYADASIYDEVYGTALVCDTAGRVYLIDKIGRCVSEPMEGYQDAEIRHLSGDGSHAFCIVQDGKSCLCIVEEL